MRVSFVYGQVLMWPKGKTIDDAVVIGEQEGLYKLKGQPEQTLVRESVEPNELWHRRLAHVHYRALPLASKVVEGLPEIQTKHDGVCKGCAKGNNIKKTFPSSESKEKGILEIIHSNVSSPISSSSLSGYALVQEINFSTTKRGNIHRKSWILPRLSVFFSVETIPPQ